MAIYLTDLANWLREANLAFVEYPGWQTRARGSGGYSAMPLCVMVHHTASPKSWDGKKDADYCAVGDEDAPLSNLYIDRGGTVWILAAGATNTNGKGNSISFSRGTVPTDGMNTRAIGIEMGNDGVGEQWTQATIDAMFAVANICNAKCGNIPEDVATHNFYAPTRKVDPATCNVAGPWKPRSCTSSGSWNREDVQTECARRAGSESTPGPSPAPSPGPTPNEDDEMLFDGFWKRDNSDAVYAIWKNGTKQWMTDAGYLEAMQALQAINGATPEQCSVRVQSDPSMFAAFGLVIGPREPGTDDWGNVA